MVFCELADYHTDNDYEQDKYRVENDYEQDKYRVENDVEIEL